MYVSKSNLRLKFISKRKNFYLKNSRFPFDKIFKLIKRNYSQKKISRIGLKDAFIEKYGNQDLLLKNNNLTVKNLVKEILK